MNKENYLEAKKLLHASIPERIVSRTKETDDIKTYLETCFNENKTLSLYVNGPPGTGKTVSICHVLDSLKVNIFFNEILQNPCEQSSI
jgi:Cdc6-like AAA superfamily ATPase